jgi:hypothetical protein
VSFKSVITKQASADSALPVCSVTWVNSEMLQKFTC